MSAVWTIAEQHGGQLKKVSFELLARGRKLADQLGASLVSIVIGHAVDESAMQDLIRSGADLVYSIQDPRLADFVVESYSRIMASLIRDHQPVILLAAATSTGRTLMPHLAIKVNTGLTADCTELDIEEQTDNLLQTRPAIGGNIMATIKTPDHRPQMATVRPKSSRPLPPDPERTGKVIAIKLEEEWIDGRVKVKAWRHGKDSQYNLEEANVVVAGGKGLRKNTNFKLLQELARSLNGAVGASRDAVDRGWIEYPSQIGLSGKTISPRLYIGVGISGAIQHLAGIKTSEIIVSINLDPEANLHKIADFAIVGDLFQILPELQRRLAARANAK